MQALVIGICLSLVVLVSGCASSGASPSAASGAAGKPTEGHVLATTVEVLEDTLQRAGVTDSNLVMETRLALSRTQALPPRPPDVWKGVFQNQDKAILQADDRLLVIAKTVACDEPNARLTFNPFIRTWHFTPRMSYPDGNRLWVLFEGTAREFVNRVTEAQSFRRPLLSMTTVQPVSRQEPFPGRVSAGAMVEGVTELALNMLDDHLRAAHAGNEFCRPEIHVYYKPSAVLAAAPAAVPAPAPSTPAAAPVTAAAAH